VTAQYFHFILVFQHCIPQIFFCLHGLLVVTVGKPLKKIGHGRRYWDIMHLLMKIIGISRMQQPAVWCMDGYPTMASAVTGEPHQNNFRRKGRLTV
jgi:hypothetical protein